ncbi:hypothetical protein PSN45_001867 [Yamadazyma tenuis]|uniref:Uncharacterized protein n=1 Tax=Candida tenuis (strain ATCC 10573 / BCRC 21748 / CBS 615 / JCM 9827 / NBRC 10315 / NRRL Y-1498 / VKM Y-70) TaxID=590646 RepID=G3BDS9_CANTC|nr:uncharacterized protein CANTEDRAFT_116420 [Yamadazyma tenuis ATCC 10573]XP_006690331.1 uncharacterized protein CANTEDRAFT_116420 [Yamadazyma tenuis ATCC 10573]EGV61116.1 hypothetical protein CANTEDRAFT_116420 [Yamadazyma tenuis ATCC 10573]EGV61117.1 hypothetical protein CANTEDRAFT_116420 [Yamadazyma tenuis ATCC 10573]WEJ94383.1 hypothetical protein PSN45_001867 [Yamadazyma tenuis]
MGHSEHYEFQAIPPISELDEHNVPLLHRDSCANPLINYYKCLDKGLTFCSSTKDEFYKCQYYLLKKRLDDGH